MNLSLYPSYQTFWIASSKFLLLWRPLLFNPNVDRESLHFESEQQLRFIVIKFLKSFAEEGVSDIMKQEASYENKKM